MQPLDILDPAPATFRTDLLQDIAAMCDSQFFSYLDKATFTLKERARNDGFHANLDHSEANLVDRDDKMGLSL